MRTSKVLILLPSNIHIALRRRNNSCYSCNAHSLASVPTAYRHHAICLSHSMPHTLLLRPTPSPWMSIRGKDLRQHHRKLQRGFRRHDHEFWRHCVKVCDASRSGEDEYPSICDVGQEDLNVYTETTNDECTNRIQELSPCPHLRTTRLCVSLHIFDMLRFGWMRSLWDLFCCAVGACPLFSASCRENIGGSIGDSRKGCGTGCCCLHGLRLSRQVGISWSQLHNVVACGASPVTHFKVTEKPMDPVCVGASDEDRRAERDG